MAEQHQSSGVGSQPLEYLAANANRTPLTTHRHRTDYFFKNAKEFEEQIAGICAEARRHSGPRITSVKQSIPKNFRKSEPRSPSGRSLKDSHCSSEFPTEPKASPAVPETAKGRMKAAKEEIESSARLRVVENGHGF